MAVEDEAARLRLWQDASLSADVDLDAVAARHEGDDDVATLVDLARSVRRLAVILAHSNARQSPRRRTIARRA